VNPLDYKLVDSLTPHSSYPFVLGVDFAGVLEESPPTDDLAAGDRVFGIARTHGSYAEYTAVPANAKAEALARIPDGIAAEHAAALPISGITALCAVNFCQLAQGQRIAGMGATGGVGGYAVQIARSRGARHRNCSSRNRRGRKLWRGGGVRQLGHRRNRRDQAEASGRRGRGPRRQTAPTQFDAMPTFSK
jgi:NADPH:quinone reductase-like Zn-dependent oxidoreductase